MSTPIQHTISQKLLLKPVNVVVVGCGGNGSQMLTGLARLDRALRAIGHPGGLMVVAFDGDNVSESNVGRQLFSPVDVGHNKASVLIHRLNMFYGLNWEARPFEFLGADNFSMRNCDIVVSCVDTARARRKIHQWAVLRASGVHYWLDMGNRSRDGQVVLGQPPQAIAMGVASPNKKSLKAKDNLPPLRLPMVTEIFPELLDENFVEDDTPSCSLAEALEKQDLFINQAVVTFALDLLWRLFRGPIDRHGAFINLESGHVNPLMIRQPELTKVTI